MKSLLTLIITFLCIHSFAQENFKIDNGSLIWQKVYETTLSTEAIVKQLKSDGNIKNIDFTDNLLTGELDIPANYKNAGYSEMSIPMYIPRNNIVCFVTIDFKDGRYRATLKNIKLKATMEDPLTKIGETSNLDSYALRKKNTEFKAQFLNVPNKIYDYTFNQIFEMNEKTDNDNW